MNDLNFHKVLLANLEKVVADNPRHPKKKHIMKQNKKIAKEIEQLARGKGHVGYIDYLV